MTKLISRFKEKYPKKKKLLLHKDRTLLQHLFWHEIIVEVCAEIKKHSALARQSVKNQPIYKNHDLFEQLLHSVESTAEITLKEREDTLSFLKTYSPKSS